jgi:hypothetical protein
VPHVHALTLALVAVIGHAVDYDSMLAMLPMLLL